MKPLFGDDFLESLDKVFGKKKEVKTTTIRVKLTREQLMGLLIDPQTVHTFKVSEETIIQVHMRKP